MNLRSSLFGRRAAVARQNGFLRRFLPVWAIGGVGVLALLTQPPPAELIAGTPELRELPEWVLRWLLLVNPLVLLTVAAGIGALLAHRVGLRSALAGSVEARLDAPTAVATGLVLAAVLVVADAALADVLGPQWRRVIAASEAKPWLPRLTLGVLYGGLTEEVLLRWGLMSLVVWSASRLIRQAGGAQGRARDGAVWFGIAASATVFALGHLPALSQSVELSGPIVARTLALNGLAGLAYGWLFWRRSLESAMLAHATTHVGLALWRGLV
jgi:membrane protease YdiL (CAAX protease family)